MCRSWVVALVVAHFGCSAEIESGSTFIVPRATAAERESVAGVSAPQPAQAGAPATTAATEAGSSAMPAASEPSPYDTETVCSSGDYWEPEYEDDDEGEEEGDEQMRPGNACIACHRGNDGPDFAIAGTVYPTAHEPDNCDGADDSGILIVITGADGQELQLEVNSAGNFFSMRGVELPFDAKVVVSGRERRMGVAQMTGDCNSCHTEQGMNGAPGRIMLP